MQITTVCIASIYSEQKGNLNWMKVYAKIMIIHMIVSEEGKSILKYNQDKKP